MEERLLALADGAGAPGLLEFAGFVARERMPEFLSGAHVFALPSPYEPGPGLVYLEAMACGLPVIGCRAAGAEEVIRDGVTGFLVRPGDAGELAEALGRILVNPGMRVQMGDAARREVLETADSPKCVRRLESLYARVARGMRPDVAALKPERWRRTNEEVHAL